MSATFSPCRTYRYSLTREIADPHIGCLDEAGGTVVFIGLNPSTADEKVDDPTIRRCTRFAREWGFERLKMVNLFAYRTPDPDYLWSAARNGVDIVGPKNDHNLSLAFGGADRIVAAWGAPAPLTIQRVADFAETFHGWQFWALGLTALGSPRHPLYMRADSQPFVYDLADRERAFR
jgi:hypothetical protein